MKMSKNFIFTKTEYGAVLLNEKKSEYLQVNLTGVIIIDGINSGEWLENISHKIASEFGITHEDAAADVDEYVQTLLSRGVIRG